VPANSFSEYAPEPNPATGKKDVVWFALGDARPLFAFVGIWTEFKVTAGQNRNQSPVRTTFYGFLTIVEPIHPKAMPVILARNTSTKSCMDGCAAAPVGSAPTTACSSHAECHLAYPEQAGPCRRKARGVLLFERSARGVQLTPLGHEIVPSANRVLAEIDMKDRARDGATE
jgi:hypothetical protein